jgi:hypothetical protein
MFLFFLFIGLPFGLFSTWAKWHIWLEQEVRDRNYDFSIKENPSQLEILQSENDNKVLARYSALPLHRKILYYIETGHKSQAPVSRHIWSIAGRAAGLTFFIMAIPSLFKNCASQG